MSLEVCNSQHGMTRQAQTRWHLKLKSVVHFLTARSELRFPDTEDTKDAEGYRTKDSPEDSLGYKGYIEEARRDYEPGIVSSVVDVDAMVEAIVDVLLDG